MTSANRHVALIAALAVAALTLTACKRPSTDNTAPTDATATNAPAESASAPDASTAPTAIVPDAKLPTNDTLPNDVVSQVDNAPGPTGIDPRVMAGRFSGGGVTLTIAADGTYTLTEQGRTSTGTWTGEHNGREVLLDPNDKADADRRYSRIDNDSLRSADTSGVSLRRDRVVAP